MDKEIIKDDKEGNDKVSEKIKVPSGKPEKGNCKSLICS